MSWKPYWKNNAKIWTKNQKIKIKCLDYADYLALFAESEQGGIKYIN